MDEEGPREGNHSGDDVPARQLRRNLLAAPTSLEQYSEARGYHSVTDLVSPVWCEYAFQYNLLGLSHLSVEERPKEIVTPAGNVVKLDINLAQKREQILHAGKDIHKQLEEEIHPGRIRVETSTKEDAWGLRLLQLVTGLRVLIESGCCRELPVFGLVEGKLVFGVIDEIKKRDEKAKSSTKKRLFTSQEEWKRSAAKKKEKKKKATLDASQSSLSSFLPSVKPAEIQEEVECQFNFVLEDTKTRRSMSMPEEKDQLQSKLQCMLYRRLIDGLLAGFATNLEGISIDNKATPVSGETLFTLLNLSDQTPLSEIFMRDAEVLCESFDLSIRVVQDTNGVWTSNLSRLCGLVTDTLDDWVAMARRGAKGKERISVVDDEMRLTYRRRGGQWTSNCRSGPESASRSEARRKQPKRAAKTSNTHGNTHTIKHASLVTQDSDEEAQMALALQNSLSAMEKSVEEEKLADQTVALESPRKRKTKDIIIGTTRFQHDALQLQEHLNDMLAMWRGERPLRGVTVEQTWRCNHCEYLSDCEWRQKKADELIQQVKSKQQDDRDHIMWSQVDDVPSDLEW